MQECNFEPDYAAWWKQKKLNKEEICWLMLGVNPEDAKKGEDYERRQETINEQENDWRNAFTDYLNASSFGHISYQEHDICMKILSWNGDKKAIVKQAYENYRKFADSFKEFLGKDFPRNEKLEAYKNHENFKPDETLSLEEITKEEDAFAVLLGLKPRDFSKFHDLGQRQKNEPRDERDLVAYFTTTVRLTRE